MTNTPGPTPGDPIGPPDGYFVEWSGASAGDTEEETGPFIGDDDTEDKNYFPTKFNWPSVEINFGDGITKYEQKIHGVVRGYRITIDKTTNEETMTPSDTNYELTKLTIESCNIGADSSGSCGDSGEWKDDEYDDRYGGVFLFTEETPVNKSSGAKSTCGTLGGSVGDEESGYIYVKVFDRSEFEYFKMNSNKSEGKFKDTFESSEFSTTPVYDDVKDKFGKAAPIYPMDSIIKFLPDGRDTVYIKYTVSLEAKVGNKKVNLRNGDITIVHAVTQNTASYPEKLQELMRYCNFNNPGNIDQEDFSKNYPTNYPYTIISESKPSKRETDGEEDGDLKKGDLWYNPSTDERYYFSGVDAPDDLEIEDPGKNYEDADYVQTSLIPPEDERCNPRDPINNPYGCRVDIKTDNAGRIISAKVSEEDYPAVANFADGDIMAVQGGNGQGKIKIVIDENKDRWVENYVTEVI